MRGEGGRGRAEWTRSDALLGTFLAGRTEPPVYYIIVCLLVCVTMCDQGLFS
jgi:hypothetical protein